VNKDKAVCDWKPGIEPGLPIQIKDGRADLAPYNRNASWGGFSQK